jgi:hypothetical protein
MNGDAVPDEAIKLWAIRHGRCCTLTPPVVGSSFIVTIWDETTPLKSVAFNDRQHAAQCAIAELNAALRDRL